MCDRIDPILQSAVGLLALVRRAVWLDVQLSLLGVDGGIEEIGGHLFDHVVVREVGSHEAKMLGVGVGNEAGESFIAWAELLDRRAFKSLVAGLDATLVDLIEEFITLAGFDDF